MAKPIAEGDIALKKEGESRVASQAEGPWMASVGLQ